MMATPSPTLLSGMTAETIAIREKILFSLHWVISFLILAIFPIIYANRKYDHYKRNKSDKSSNKTNTSPGNNDETSPALHPNTLHLPSTHNVADNSVSNYSNNSNLQQPTRVSTKSTSRTVYVFRNITLKKVFEILALVCIFLWWSRAVTAACSLMIWHYDYLIALDIAIPWDIARAFIYILSKLIMYLSYLMRIYYSFDKSAYKYSKCFIMMLFVMILIDFILKLIGYIMLGTTSSGALQDKGKANDFMNGLFIFLIIEEFVLATTIIIVFIKPLVMISKRVLRDNILHVVIKYAILGLTSILSSILLSMFRLFYIDSDDLMLIWLTSIFVSIDCLVNSWCTILLFGTAKPIYRKMCGFCDGNIRKCVKDLHAKHVKPSIDIVMTHSHSLNAD